jgi:hypothetical protein
MYVRSRVCAGGNLSFDAVVQWQRQQEVRRENVCVDVRACVTRKHVFEH